ncbi:unnamed protein product [Effrenium voratum]|nr:unnamed protein product [Effrenium voratum]
MPQAKVQLNVIIYNATISACGKGGQWQQGLGLFGAMPQAKVQPTLVSYNAVLDAIFDKPHGPECFDSGLSAHVFPKLMNATPRIIDLHELSEGAAQLAVRWWLATLVAPSIGKRLRASEAYKCIIITGYGRSRKGWGTSDVQAAVLNMLRTLKLSAGVLESNAGRLQLVLRKRNMPLLQQCVKQDSHVEATTGWLEPLLARIKEDPAKVVLPKVDSIDAETFAWTAGGGIGTLGFSWSLGQRSWAAPDHGPDGTAPARSPIMPGGLFASDRRWFLALGGYDQEMRLYGGEEMEISFRTWMCGGEIEHVPCSHVGHVFRNPKYWQGQVYEVPGAEIARNKLRAAEVWMDDYKKLVQIATMPLPKRLPLGDVTLRRKLREELKCESFRWFLDHVATGMRVPNISSSAQVGALRNARSGLCLDTMGNLRHGDAAGLFPCHGQRGAQAFVLADDGQLLLPTTNYMGCLATRKKELVIEACDGTKHQRWSYQSLQLQVASRCLAVAVAAGSFKLRVTKCSSLGNISELVPRKILWDSFVMSRLSGQFEATSQRRTPNWAQLWVHLSQAEKEPPAGPGLRVLELFAGIGGMRCALERSQLQARVVAAIDVSELCEKAYCHNFGKDDWKKKTIECLRPQDLDALEADLWLMSPPCQPFTRSGKRCLGSTLRTSFS